ncbi:hypothetical protein BJV82DRAFT_676830 [Fennellomyces sp. T-0311]|nr:hypothetical protein BJV82DRAFT_676830 [Fennellomyces sp. T-0311]
MDPNNYEGHHPRHPPNRSRLSHFSSLEPYHDPFERNFNILFARMDRMENTIAQLGDAVTEMRAVLGNVANTQHLLSENLNNLLGQHVVHPASTEPEQPAREQTPDEGLPDLFVKKPTLENGNTRKPVKEDIVAAVRSMSSSDAEGQKKYIELCNHVDGVIKFIKQLVPKERWGLSFTAHGDVCNRVMSRFLTSVSSKKPFLPLDRCEDNWIARHMVMQDWNSVASNNKASKAKKSKRRSDNRACDDNGST